MTFPKGTWATALRKPTSFELHASLGAIDAAIAKAVAAREAAQRELERLLVLREHRETQIAAGLWPAKPSPVPAVGRPTTKDPR